MTSPESRAFRGSHWYSSWERQTNTRCGCICSSVEQKKISLGKTYFINVIFFCALHGLFCALPHTAFLFRCCSGTQELVRCMKNSSREVYCKYVIWTTSSLCDQLHYFFYYNQSLAKSIPVNLKLTSESSVSALNMFVCLFVCLFGKINTYIHIYNDRK